MQKRLPLKALDYPGRGYSIKNASKTGRGGGQLR
jgi:hypothetical protein